MITLFTATGSSEKSDVRDAYLERLHEIFDEGDRILSPVTDEGQPISNEDRTMTSAPQVSLEPAENAPSETFERLARQIAAKFAEAFVFAFREMGMEHGQTQALRAALSEVSQRVDRLSAELISQPREIHSVVSRLAVIDGRLSEHQRVDAARDERLQQLEQRFNKGQEVVQQQMAGVSAGVVQTNERLETLAQAVEAQARATDETTDVSRKFQQAQQTLQKRLDVQAEAIRLVHSDAEERDDRLKEFRAALEKAKEVFASLPSGKPLPEGL